MLVVNFGHPLTDEQRAHTEALSGRAIERVIDVPAHFDDEQPFAPQVAALVERAGLTPTQWQTLPLLVNLPSYGPIVAVLLAYLHGLSGHFPTVFRLCRSEDGSVAVFEVMEVLISTESGSPRVRRAEGGEATMSRQRPRHLTRYFDPEDPNIIWFFIGSLALGVAGNSASELLRLVLSRSWFGWDAPLTIAWLVPLILLAIALGGLYVTARVIEVYVQIIARRPSAPILRRDEEVGQRRGLVVLVSPGRGKSHEPAIRYHERDDVLEHCWLVHSKESYDAAKATKADAKHPDRFHLCPLDDPNDVKHGLEKIRGIIAEAMEIDPANPISPGDLVIDITGGLKPMTAAAVLACVDRSAILQYMRSERDKSGEILKHVDPVAMRVNIALPTDSLDTS